MLFSKPFSAGFGGQSRNIPLSSPEPAFFIESELLWPCH